MSKLTMNPPRLFYRLLSLLFYFFFLAPVGEFPSFENWGVTGRTVSQSRRRRRFVADRSRI